MSARGDVIFWGAAIDGTRRSSVDLGNVRVHFEPRHASHNDEAAALALDFHQHEDRRDALVDRADVREREAMRCLREARDKIDALRAKLPPDAPIRFLGPCCVRFDRTGRGIWLLNDQKKGWSSFGLRFESWDDVFRRYDARVTGHGSDEHGAFWTLENREQDEASK